MIDNNDTNKDHHIVYDFKKSKLECTGCKKSIKINLENYEDDNTIRFREKHKKCNKLLPETIRIE